MKFLEKACDRGEGFACYHLARNYSNGEGVETDEERAQSLLTKTGEKYAKFACDALDK